MTRASVSTHPTISLVTPNHNGAAFLRRAVESVLSQGYPALEYVVIDAASTDGSRAILEEYREALTALIIEPDEGHAEALNKGFARTTGEIMGWLNSDDVLLPGALHRLARAFAACPDAQWITGRATSCDAAGRLLAMEPAKIWTRSSFLSVRQGYIQQESTFWRRSLWEQAGAKLDTGYRLATDYELWARFFRHAPPFTLDAPLGCFRLRDGQRSVTQKSAYEAEAGAVRKREQALSAEDARGTAEPSRLIGSRTGRLERAAAPQACTAEEPKAETGPGASLKRNVGFLLAAGAAVPAVMAATVSAQGAAGAVLAALAGVVTVLGLGLGALIIKLRRIITAQNAQLDRLNQLAAEQDLRLLLLEQADSERSSGGG